MRRAAAVGILALTLFAFGCAHRGCTTTSRLTTAAASYRFETLTVYRVGSEGPEVILLHELPGLSPATFALAEEIAGRGYRVHLPLLFGARGDNSVARGFVAACFARDITCFDDDDPGRRVRAIDRLAAHLAAQSGRAVGVIGMCLTGSWPVALLRPGGPVAAAVLSQPSLPFLKKESIGLGTTVMEAAVASGVPILALRFSNDRISPAEKMETFQRGFGGQLRAIVIPSGCASPWGIRDDAHAVLTRELSAIPDHPTRRALEDVLAYLDDRLKGDL